MRMVESAFATIISAIVVIAAITVATDTKASTTRSHSSPSLHHLPSCLNHHQFLLLHFRSLILAAIAFARFA